MIFRGDVSLSHGLFYELQNHKVPPGHRATTLPLATQEQYQSLRLEFMEP